MLSGYYWEFCEVCDRPTNRPKPRDGWNCRKLYVNGKGPLCVSCYEELNREAEFQSLITRNSEVHYD